MKSEMLNSYLVRNNFLRSLQGKNTDIQSPLLRKGFGTRSSAISQLKRAIPFNRLPKWLMEVEMNELKKTSPFSIQLPFYDRRDHLFRYWTNKGPKNLPVVLKSKKLRFVLLKACSKVSDLLPKNSLKPTAPDDAYNSLDKTTNWGFPIFGPGSVTGKQHLGYAKFLLSNLNYIDPQNNNLLVFLGWRGQQSAELISKQRDVWCFPHSISIIEKMYLDPVIKYIQDNSLIQFGGLKDLYFADHAVTKIVSNSMRYKYFRVFSVDYSGYDLSLHPSLISFIIERTFVTWFGSEDQVVIRRLIKYFTDCRMILPDYSIKSGSHGVPSGSGFTNLFDSIINIVIFEFLSLLLKVDGACTAQGDDAIYCFHSNKEIIPLNTENYSFYSSLFGLVANPGKQTIFDQDSSDKICSFCQMWYDFSNRFPETPHVVHGIRSVSRVFLSMLSHERFPYNFTYKDHVVRWLMQMNYCVYHPLIQHFVQFIKSVDKYKLGERLEISENDFESTRIKLKQVSYRKPEYIKANKLQIFQYLYL